MRQIRACFSALALSALAGCMVMIPKTLPAVALHETARDEGWTMEVCQLAGRKGGAKEFLPLADGHTVLASYGPRVWFMSLPDVLNAISDAFGPPKERPPLPGWQVVHDDAIRIFDISSGQQKHSLWVPDEEHGLFDITSDSKTLVWTGPDHNTLAWDVATWKNVPNDGLHPGKLPQPELPAWLKQKAAQDGSMSQALLSPDSHWVYVPNGRGFDIRDAQTSEVAGRVRTEIYGTSEVHWLADSSGLDFFNSRDWQVVRVHLPKTLPRRERPLTPARVISLPHDYQRGEPAMSPDGSVVIASNNLWEALATGPLVPWPVEQNTAVQISDDGKRAMVVARNHVTVLQVEGHEHVPSGPKGAADFQGRDARAYWIGHDARALTCDSGHLICWNIFGGEKVWEANYAPMACSAHISGDGRQIVLGLGAGNEWHCALADPQTGKLTKPLALHSTPQRQINGCTTLSRSGNVAVFEFCNWTDPPHNNAIFYDLQRDSTMGVVTLMENDHPILSPDGALAVIRGENRVLELIDTSSGKAVGRLETPSEYSWACFTTDGRIFTVDAKAICEWAKPTPADLAGIILPVSLATGIVRERN